MVIAITVIISFACEEASICGSQMVFFTKDRWGRL
jgi:hypothetical protein